MVYCIFCQKELTSRKAKKFCSNICQTAHQYREYINEWLDGKQNGQKYEGEVSNHVRRWLHENHNSKCSKCGWGEINQTSKKVPLQVNHIDGDHNNHSHNNIELLCPNCHSLTPNYGKLNNGNGRKKRLMKLTGTF